MASDGAFREVGKIALADQHLAGIVGGAMPEDAGEGREPGMGIGFVFESELERAQVEATVEKLMIESLGPVLFKKLLAHRKDPGG